MFGAANFPRRVWVPCIGYPHGETPLIKPAGLAVSRGQPLVYRPSPQWHAALAPANGVIVGPGSAWLTATHEVPAVAFDVDPGPAEGSSTTGVVANPPSAPPASRRDLPFSGWIDRLRNLGVWADRWTSPDLLAQLHACLRRPIDTVVCNILDVDPALPLQAMVAGQWPAEVMAGVATFASLTGAGRAWLAVSSSIDESAWTTLRSALSGTDVRLVPLRNDFPRANPGLLMRELSDRPLRPGQLPPEQGVLMLDAAAALAAGRCFLHDEPMLTAPLAVFDQITGRAYFRTVPVGAKLRDVLTDIDVETFGARLFAGTPLRQELLNGDCVVGGGELTIYRSTRIPDTNPDSCIRCAWCVEACPVNIQPAGILEAAQREDPQLAHEYGLEACIECGICAYVCPSHLPLLEGVRTLRRSQRNARTPPPEKDARKETRRNPELPEP